MTREEAIDFGKMWLEVQSDSKDTSTYKFFVMAIEALEQQSCEDAISRQAVLDVLKKHWLEGTVAHRVIDEIGSSIKVLPPVTPKEKTGKWIMHPKGIYAHLVCNKCLSGAPYDYKTNFCPNCGAKMEVEE